MIGFIKKFDDKKTLSFKVTDKKLLKHQNMGKRYQFNKLRI